MTLRIAIVAPGEMGSGVGRKLVQNGLTVLTSLKDRSAASAGRAARAGLVDAADDDALAACDIILSIVPPKDALGLAERLQPALARAARKPLYVDCNAIAPRSVERIAALVASTGARFVDAGIIGPPPSDTQRSATTFYASGAAAPDFAALSAHGLTIRVLDKPVGAASALKMSYAGLTKGLTALGTAMILGASEAGVSDALKRELAESQPHFLSFLQRSVPGMFPKAYRWIAEMEEIAAFADDVAGGQDMYRGVADLYRRIADDMADDPDAQRELVLLRDFCLSASAAPTRKQS
jgi:3-hydroxyisobutyrate dehydrogenase-like beta-hydroxyacid dehydrogenase